MSNAFCLKICCQAVPDLLWGSLKVFYLSTLAIAGKPATMMAGKGVRGEIFRKVGWE